jgi:hypothetical protein
MFCAFVEAAEHVTNLRAHRRDFGSPPFLLMAMISCHRLNGTTIAVALRLSASMAVR